MRKWLLRTNDYVKIYMHNLINITFIDEILHHCDTFSYKHIEIQEILRLTINMKP